MATADRCRIEQHPAEKHSWQLVDGCYKPIWFKGQQLPGCLIPDGDDLEEKEDEGMAMASSDESGSSDDD